MSFCSYEELKEVPSRLLFLVSPKYEGMGLSAEKRSGARVWLVEYRRFAQEGSDAVRSLYLVLWSPTLRRIQ